MRRETFFLFQKRDNLIIYVIFLAQHETKYTNTKHGKIKYLLTNVVKKKKGYAPCVASIIAIIVQPPNPLRFHCITLLFGSMVTSLFHWDDNRWKLE